MTNNSNNISPTDAKKPTLLEFVSEQVGYIRDEREFFSRMNGYDALNYVSEYLEKYK